ncbi:MAG: cytochrome c3 family protein [bacterium]|nr:cytochrome c3 family protein [bacterium]
MSKGAAFTAILVFTAVGAFGAPVDFETINTHEDGSRTLPVHLIPLYDEYGEEIGPNDVEPRPFSPRITCGKCHDYETIGSGWHFNSHVDGGKPGRSGEPWFLVDVNTGTQAPVSNREWPGVWTPDAFGLTPWQFTKTFGRHTPGGDMAELDDEVPDPNARWHVSGPVEINCLACHNADLHQDMSEWVKQLARENFRWAATAASGLAVVDNVAARLPDSYDPIDGPNPDNPWAAPPSVSYDASRFDDKNRVFFDIPRKPPANRCYFCHTAWDPCETGSEGAACCPKPADWQQDGDVHMARGMTCVDCHRNGLDHDMVRGFEGEETDPFNATLSCRGCHMGDETAPGGHAMGGRFMAPTPKHLGLPAVHIEKMTCTSCHSGPWPGAKTGTVRTSRANRLGVHGRARWYTDLPYIASPVFMRDEAGITGLYDLVWPAFWGVRNGEEVTPLPLDVVTAAVDRVRAEEKAARVAEAKAAAEAAAEAAKAAEAEEAEEADAETEEAEEPETAPTEEVEEPEVDRRLNRDQVLKVLAMLAEDESLGGEPVYVADGLVRARKSDTSMTSAEHPVANPYTWAIGHDVRPAAQALGANGCRDCHDKDAPFFCAKVAPESPVTGLGVRPSLRMLDLQEQPETLLAALGGMARFRGVFLGGMALLIGALTFILAWYGVLGLESAFRALVATGKRVNR